MQRRNALKLMIASMTAPVYIANGLMRVKPVIVPETADIWDVYSDDGFHYTYGANGSVLLRKSRFHFMPIVPIHTPVMESPLFPYEDNGDGTYYIEQDQKYSVSVKQMSIGEIKQEYGKDLYHG